uniref:Uncharacterized protein n=1 Tax=Panagrolaimus sp. JU765 TaxID=591449 RepID=A0AC34QD01_9BILA
MSPGDDEIVFHVYSLSEKEKKKNNRLRITIHLEILSNDDRNLKIKHFRDELTIVSGGSTLLDPNDFQIDHREFPPTDIFYYLIQKGSNGIRVVILDSPATDEIIFSQAQINKNQIRLEHTPMSTDDRFDVLVFGIGNETRILTIRVEPLALNLFNHSIITYEQ